ncbi:hypothetical protein BLGI_2600 [Brevibacillus laterosporus GI-9]|nr:hypothetical protein BLGI_2600 [Brevibacillus laterosporus GI-9]
MLLLKNSRSQKAKGVKLKGKPRIPFVFTYNQCYPIQT